MDFLQLFSQGQEIKAHGEIYITLYSLWDGFYLASKKGEGCPAIVYCVKKDDETEEGEMKKDK